MTIRRCLAGAVFGCVAIGVVSCQHARHRARHQEEGPAAAAPVHAIDLPHFQSNLPPAPGREEFASSCLSCHSASYILMQPPLTQAKWEDEVRKMIKTYGAPIDETLAPQIAGYIVAVKESGTVDLSVTPVAKPASAAHVDMNPARLSSADLGHGKTVYAQSCASCHGPTGAGDGPNAGSMLPPATNLTATRYTAQAIADAVTRGVPATAMPSFPSLSADDVRDVVAFTQTLTKPAPAEDHALDDAELTSAAGLFEQNCAACHGERGAGDGALAPIAPRPPTDFRRVQPSTETAFNAISNGVAGTTMPSWKAKFAGPQRRLLAAYVRSLHPAEEGQ